MSEMGFPDKLDLREVPSEEKTIHRRTAPGPQEEAYEADSTQSADGRTHAPVRRLVD